MARCLLLPECRTSFLVFLRTASPEQKENGDTDFTEEGSCDNVRERAQVNGLKDGFTHGMTLLANSRICIRIPSQSVIFMSLGFNP